MPPKDKLDRGNSQIRVSSEIFFHTRHACTCNNIHVLYKPIHTPCTGSFFRFSRRIAMLSLRITLPPKLTAQRDKETHDQRRWQCFTERVGCPGISHTILKFPPSLYYFPIQMALDSPPRYLKNGDCIQKTGGGTQKQDTTRGKRVSGWREEG